MPRVASKLTSNARSLRNRATAEERLLWIRLRHARPRFTRQLPVGRYILDFACRTLRLAVEIDGSQHLDAVRYDAARSRSLEGLGWHVLRFWNSEVRDNPDGVAEAIMATVALRLRRTHPQPLPFREGRE
jgi:very-short-patch-repair endonuclease